jgi:hypothetical protein
LNPNYITIVKHDVDKLLTANFIKPIEKATWPSPIIVVLKKNENLRICVNFIKLNVVTKKDPYSLPFTNEVINIVVRHEVYTFLYGFFRYHQISITL